jgi:hypothetical protein
MAQPYEIADNVRTQQYSTHQLRDHLQYSRGLHRNSISGTLPEWSNLRDIGQM